VSPCNSSFFFLSIYARLLDMKVNLAMLLSWQVLAIIVSVHQLPNVPALQTGMDMAPAPVVLLGHLAAVPLQARMRV